MEEFEMPRAAGDDPADPDFQIIAAEGPIAGRTVAPPRITAPLPVAPVAFETAVPYPAPPAPAARPAAPVTPEPRARQHGRSGSPLLVLMLLLALLTGGLGGGVSAWTLAQSGTLHPAVAAAPVAASAQPVVDQSASAISLLYKRVASSVVDIQTTVGGGRRFSGTGEGSGIVLDSSHVLTNYHVVQGATSIRIVLQDGTTVDATVAGTSPTDDLAVVTANLPAGKVQAATLGDSSSVQVGDEVIAVGSPFGLDHTVTAGIISAVNRQWSGGNGPKQAMLQTDAPINPGNSGGPLFNLQGQVIGINTAIDSPVEGSVGVGFSIPINRAKALLPQLTQGQ